MTSTTTETRPAAPDRRWRTVDIIVTSVIAVACGVVFWAWSLLYAAVSGAFTAFPPAGGVMVGLWVLPAVLAPLIVRKPGVAIYAELVAASVEGLLGNQWGLSNVYYGLIEGVGAEIIFLVFAYRYWGRVPALLAGALAALAGAAVDITLYYPTWAASWKVGYLALVAVSGAVLAGVLGLALTRALARTGVLAPFASGQSRR